MGFFKGIAVLFSLFAIINTSNSITFENQAFQSATSKAFDEFNTEVSKSTVSDIRFLSVSYNGNELSVAVGNKDFDVAKYLTLADKYEELGNEYSNLSADAVTNAAALAALEAEMMPVATELNTLGENIKTGTVKVENLTTLDDIKYFTSVEFLEVSGITLTDSSVFSDMDNLIYLNAYGCGLTEVKGLADLDAAKVKEINLAGNEITDWSALNYIADKVIVSSTYSIEMTENGNYTFVPVEQTLADYNVEQAEAETADTEETANAE